MFSESERTTIGDPTNARIAQVRLRQLEHLINRGLDGPVTWEEKRAVKTPFFDSYTYKTANVKVQVGSEGIERIRNFAIFQIVDELCQMGYGHEAKVILSLANSSQTENIPSKKI